MRWLARAAAALRPGQAAVIQILHLQERKGSAVGVLGWNSALPQTRARSTSILCIFGPASALWCTPPPARPAQSPCSRSQRSSPGRSPAAALQGTRGRTVPPRPSGLWGTAVAPGTYWPRCRPAQSGSSTSCTSGS